MIVENEFRGYAVKKSELDNSVNFIKKNEVGMIEARYVRREERYFIVYLSSQTGCNRGCKFCHLTATGQTAYTDLSIGEILDQAVAVMEYMEKEISTQGTREVNFNFMARGEPLSNQNILMRGNELLEKLHALARGYGLVPKFNISTIMPRNLAGKSLAEIFHGFTPTIYYSLYSIDCEFRKKWMPGALHPHKALSMLKEYQDTSSKVVRLHGTFIQDENDSERSVREMMNLVRDYGILFSFNLVRYNPYSVVQGQESSPEVLERNLEIIREFTIGNVKEVSRVGFDVKASCGMFYSKEDI